MAIREPMRGRGRFCTPLLDVPWLNDTLRQKSHALCMYSTEQLGEAHCPLRTGCNGVFMLFEKSSLLDEDWI